MIDHMIQSLDRGGPALWVIFALSVVLFTISIWKSWHLAQMGAWRHRRLVRVLGHWAQGNIAAAKDQLGTATDVRTQMARAAIDAILTPTISETDAKDECMRVGRAILHQAKSGLRLIELIASIAPLVGLLGTVLGMIDAFQALQESGNQADPAALAGGIWQALLTTAAGMGVAIPASMFLSWFDSVVDAIQADIEDAATQIFVNAPKE
jgi:biopolymer transport protein ExbB